MPVRETVPTGKDSVTALLAEMFPPDDARGRPGFRQQKQTAAGKHRPKIFPLSTHWPAMVARAVGKDERMNNPKAKEALDTEWAKLVGAGKHGAFNPKLVKEKWRVQKEAKESAREEKLTEWEIRKNLAAKAQRK